MPAQGGRKIVAIGHRLTPASLATLAMHGCIYALPNRRPTDYLTVRADGIAGLGLPDRGLVFSRERVVMERRLAAIFAADVAGYSRLMGADEEGTLERLRAHRRELIDPKIAEHQGRIVKTTGDGVLVEFASPVKAVRCAVEVQHGMVDRNADVPREQRIEFRIGINLRDVVVG